MTGQIKLTSKAGKVIFNLSCQNDVNTIVEIGTWHGGGSTFCVLEAIKNTNKHFTTIECNETMYNSAQKFNPNNKNVKFLLGRIVDINELDITNLSREETQWLQSDIDAMEKTKNILHELPNEIDLLILDGGEFSSRAEFLKLKNRCRYIFLDDTTFRKNKINRQEMIDSDCFDMVIDDQFSRNGFSVFKRIS